MCAKELVTSYLLSIVFQLVIWFVYLSVYLMLFNETILRFINEWISTTPSHYSCTEVLCFYADSCLYSFFTQFLYALYDFSCILIN